MTWWRFIPTHLPIRMVVSNEQKSHFFTFENTAGFRLSNANTIFNISVKFEDDIN